MSGVGKGIAVASIGCILRSRGYKVTAIKIDPYINVDAGTMNPVEHGEVFVTDDGDETDQDIGNYERFLDTDITSLNYMTTGRVYKTVIERERNLEYNGRCVEVVPHIPEEVIRRIKAAVKRAKAEICIVEIGGTVGEYQNILFLEAARMMKLKNPKDVLVALVSYLPIPTKVGEMKTKPTQNAVHQLNSAGIQPDIILARAERPLDAPRKRKLSLFCSVLEKDIISAPDVDSIYEVPLNFEREGLSRRIIEKLDLGHRMRDLKKWSKLVRTIKTVKKPVRVALVGKYFETGEFVLPDAYISVIEAVKHAAWAAGRKPDIQWVNAEEFEKNPKAVSKLKSFDGVIVPGGFGKRGVEGKIAAIRYLREQKIPFLGLCYGMQLATIEFARHVAGMAKANTTEVDPKTPYPVIHIMPEQEAIVGAKRYGGTMRLGAYPCVLNPKSESKFAYGRRLVSERHRHRYELNNDYREKLAGSGLLLAGTSPDGKLVEIMEIPAHPFFIGTQFHPEFKSRPLNPHPLFREFIKAAIVKKDKHKE